jgi:hypothetical protein
MSTPAALRTALAAPPPPAKPVPLPVAPPVPMLTVNVGAPLVRAIATWKHAPAPPAPPEPVPPPPPATLSVTEHGYDGHEYAVRATAAPAATTTTGARVIDGVDDSETVGVTDGDVVIDAVPDAVGVGVTDGEGDAVSVVVVDGVGVSEADAPEARGDAVSVVVVEGVIVTEGVGVGETAIPEIVKDLTRWLPAVALAPEPPIAAQNVALPVKPLPVAPGSVPGGDTLVSVVYVDSGAETFNNAVDAVENVAPSDAAYSCQYVGPVGLLCPKTPLSVMAV